MSSSMEFQRDGAATANECPCDQKLLLREDSYYKNEELLKDDIRKKKNKVALQGITISTPYFTPETY